MPMFLMFSKYFEEMFSSYKARTLGMAVVGIALLGVTLLLASEPQDVRQRAAEPVPTQAVCPTPPVCEPGQNLEANLEDSNEVNQCAVYQCVNAE